MNINNDAAERPKAMKATNVIFDSKVPNDEKGIYFVDTPKNQGLGLLRFEIYTEDLGEMIRKGCKFIIEKYGIMPSVVFVPFRAYSHYQINCDATKFEAKFIFSLREICRDEGVRLVIMTPSKMSRHIGIDKEP